MNSWRIETKCLQEGYKPGNGEPHVLPICQSTTYRYKSTEQVAKLFDLEEAGICILELVIPQWNV